MSEEPEDGKITLSVRIDPAARSALGRIAARRAASPSAVAREIVNEYLYDNDGTYRDLINARISAQEEKFKQSSGEKKG